MSKKTPVFTPIDSGIKKDAPTPIEETKVKEKEKEEQVIKPNLMNLMNLCQIN